MSPPTPRARRRRAREQSILDAAMKILVRDGLEGLTIQELARATDYTPGAVYRYFVSKDAIFAALQVRTFVMMNDAFSEAQKRFAHVIESCPDTTLERPHVPLSLFILRARMYTLMPETRPGWFTLVHLAVYEPKMIVPDNEIVLPVIEQTGNLIQEIVALLEGVRNDCPAFCSSLTLHQAAVSIWMALHGNLSIRKFARFDPTIFDMQLLADNAITTMLVGWGVKPEDIALSRAWLTRFESEKPLWGKK